MLAPVVGETTNTANNADAANDLRRRGGHGIITGGSGTAADAEGHALLNLPGEISRRRPLQPLRSSLTRTV